MTTTREITDHHTNECNRAIHVVADERDPNSGYASHHYTITLDRSAPDDPLTEETRLRFQRGPIKEAGINGITNEVLLAIVIDRLEGFQSGPFACDENAAALHHVRAALSRLEDRTRARAVRGVEGTHEP